MMETIKNIRILEKEANKRGDLFTRLMKDLFLILGYDNPRFNIHKSGREIDIEADHRTENKRMLAECKATEEKSGGDDINKFVGALDAEKEKEGKKGKKKKFPDSAVEGYFVSLSGFKESAIEQEKEAGNRVILMDGQRIIEELIRGNIIVSPLKVMECAAHCAAGHGENLRADESFELLAHDMGWIWVVYFLQNKQKTHFALIHADGEALAREPAQAVIHSDQSVGGVLHTLEYLAPAGHPATSDRKVKEALDKYLHYLEQECGDITLEGMPADQEVGPRRLNLENIFVPLHLVISAEQEQKQDLFSSAGEIANKKEKKKPNRLPVGRLLSKYPYLAILASPGAGKTTLIKRLAVAYAFPQRRALIADELPDKKWLPLLIRCRQLGAAVSSPISDILCDIARRAELNDWKEAFSCW